MVNKKYTIPNIIKENPNSASIISKLTASRERSGVGTSKISAELPIISLHTQNKIQMNDDITMLFPDTELCIEILVSSILSPNDLRQSNLIYTAPEIKLPGSVRGMLLDMIETHIDRYYNLRDKLPIMLREALFTKGVYIEAIIPEASLDDIISQYSLKKSQGALKTEDIKVLEQGIKNNLVSDNIYLSSHNPIYSLKTEELKISDKENKPMKFGTSVIEITQEDLGIELTDNYRILSINNYNIELRKRAMKEQNSLRKSMSQEDMNDIDRFFRAPSEYSYQEMIEVPTEQLASRKSIGRPLVFKLPTESVIPVHVKMDPSTHLGYFVLVDENGTPILNDTEMMRMASNPGYNVNNEAVMDSKLNLISKTSKALFGMTNPAAKLSNLEELYSNIVETMIKKKLQDGMLGDLVEVRNNLDLYRTMLYRALNNMQTKILFLPSELVSYIAFEYRENGTGKSLIEKTSVLYSIRSIILFTRIMAYIKNSTTITKVNATLDENDPDPATTIEKIKSEVMKTRQQSFPLGAIRADDLADWAQKMGLTFKFNHPALNNIEIDVSDANTSKIIPDEELERQIQEYIIMSYGLTPEMVQAGYNPEFATTIVSNNLLMAKRIQKRQTEFTVHLSKHIRKIMNNDMLLIDGLKKTIKNNIAAIKKTLKGESDQEKNIKNMQKISDNKLVDYIVEKFCNELIVELPKPETPGAQTSKEAYESFKDVLEGVMDDMFNTEALNDRYAGKLSEEIDNVKAVFKAMLTKKWMDDNNYIPQLSEFFIRDDEGNPVTNLLDDYENFIKHLNDLLLPFFKTRSKDRNKANQKLEKAGLDDDGSSDDYGSDDGDYGNDDEGSEDEGDSGDESGGEEGGGSDDFGVGGDDDFGGGDFGGGGDEGDEEPEEDKKDDNKDEDKPTDDSGGIDEDFGFENTTVTKPKVPFISDIDSGKRFNTNII